MAMVERHRTQRIGWLRAAVLGANDGIVSTASLIVGVAAAESSRSSVLVAGSRDSVMRRVRLFCWFGHLSTCHERKTTHEQTRSHPRRNQWVRSYRANGFQTIAPERELSSRRNQ
ncbi:MAG: VIT1/CCC1 transporter family protein [Deferrisomatales bacterium]|nr:VIT1/CCC1 transporter family protein [Deferrisomatales bacterium]